MLLKGWLPLACPDCFLVSPSTTCPGMVSPIVGPSHINPLSGGCLHRHIPYAYCHNHDSCPVMSGEPSSLVFIHCLWLPQTSLSLFSNDPCILGWEGTAQLFYLGRSTGQACVLCAWTSWLVTVCRKFVWRGLRGALICVSCHVGSRCVCFWDKVREVKRYQVDDTWTII